MQAIRLEESQKLAAERETLDASKREVEARVQALMGKEYGMVKVGSSCHSLFLVKLAITPISISICIIIEANVRTCL